jgi:ribonuclease BN (tRNA processing enzyme)
MFKIIILGSGSCIPSKDRGYPGAIINYNKKWMLFDAGSGTLDKIAAFGIDSKEIDVLFFSHLHPDHTVDLITFLLELNYTPDYTRTRKLEIYGPEGLKKFIKGLQKVYPHIKPNSYSLEINELSDSEISIYGFQLSSRNVKHANMPSLAFKFDDGTSMMTISGDVGFCQNIIDISANADLLILESSFPTSELSNDAHLTAGESGKIARLAKAKNLVVKHMYPVCDDYDMKSLISKEYDGNIVISEDLTELELSGGTLKII